MPRQQLDLTNPITQNDKATSYLEALFYELFAAVDTTPQTVLISSNVATVDLSKGSQFNIEADDDFEIDIIGVESLVSRKNSISIANPAGAFDLTDITSTGATVYKTAGSSISILGSGVFDFLMIVPSETEIHVLPFEMEPV